MWYSKYEDEIMIGTQVKQMNNCKITKDSSGRYRLYNADGVLIDEANNRYCLEMKAKQMVDYSKLAYEHKRMTQNQGFDLEY